MKIRPVGTEWFHADGRTDAQIREQINTFGNFANAPIKELSKHNLNVTRA